MKPVPRSKVRLAAGMAFFRWKRYLKWCFGGIRFAKTFAKDDYPYLVFVHETPTLRKLKDVDMWLQHNKEINLQLAVKRLDGLIIRPGETMSYWKLIGNPTRRKGYAPGMVLFYGGFKPGIGGGLCQLSNLIYWMTLHTPLTVVERHRHSYDVFPDSNRTQPFGSGATCAYNYLDLMIANRTDSPYQLKLEVRNHRLTGEWRALTKPLHTYEVYEKDHLISQQYWGGYVRHNTLFRRVYSRDGQLAGDEYITENHALMMYSPLLPESVNKVQHS
ncbi:VanW family protein [Paenibacillus sp. sptzw28]|uniref:VanW family protein n=1 Tax=Paenibacillus sp. sptzw28 TaxID=715179 RepID=UPI001C6EE488|nr:VanW family protein [Paenibacillus sp. sptzw28]QYR24379.1 VanW family protein [Paenibacillus sp. sptzw28]